MSASCAHLVNIDSVEFSPISSRRDTVKLISVPKRGFLSIENLESEVEPNPGLTNVSASNRISMTPPKAKLRKQKNKMRTNSTAASQILDPNVVRPKSITESVIAKLEQFDMQDLAEINEHLENTTLNSVKVKSLNFFQDILPEKSPRPIERTKIMGEQQQPKARPLTPMTPKFSARIMNRSYSSGHFEVFKKEQISDEKPSKRTPKLARQLSKYGKLPSLDQVKNNFESKLLKMAKTTSYSGHGTKNFQDLCCGRKPRPNIQWMMDENDSFDDFFKF